MNAVEQEAFRARLGSIAWDVDRDQYNNTVSHIRLTGGAAYRMVHHQRGFKERSRYTVYAGRGKFVRVKTHAPDNDCIMHSCEIAGFGQCWGDGDPLGATVPAAANATDLGPMMRSLLNRISSDDFDTVILLVLTAIKDHDTFWEHKEPIAAERAQLGLARIAANLGRY